MGKLWMPHLHCHDEYSIKDGCSSVETYSDLVVKRGGGSVAITNHGQATGWARQWFACRDRKLKALLIMMDHYEKREWKIPEKKVDGVTMIEVKIEKMTAKHDSNDE